MKISYKKLWKFLIDRDMKKQDLQKNSGISGTTIAKLSKGENMYTDVLVKICESLHCDINEIMELVEDNEKLEANK